MIRYLKGNSSPSVMRAMEYIINSGLADVCLLPGAKEWPFAEAISELSSFAAHLHSVANVIENDY